MGREKIALGLVGGLGRAFPSRSVGKSSSFSEINRDSRRRSAEWSSAVLSKNIAKVTGMRTRGHPPGSPTVAKRAGSGARGATT